MIRIPDDSTLYSLMKVSEQLIPLYLILFITVHIARPTQQR